MIVGEHEQAVHFRNFGKYEIIRKLSRSLTDVYLARDVEKDRRVVLKLVEHARDELTELIIAAERRGALIQKQLHEVDRRILEIYDFGEQNNCFFLTMEYCEGRTLAQVIRTEGRMEPQRAARYTAEICSQLKTLHSFVPDLEGRKTAVVHGDIKPSNVQIGAHDEVRLLDFGIAKIITFTHNLTHHNLGSPSYCSPERLEKGQVDRHADLWAVGISLFEMISGTPPYQAQDTRKLENLIQSRRPPRALPEHCPAALKAVVSKALAPDLARRYGSADTFESDLRAFLADRPTIAEREHPVPFDANATVEWRAEPGSDFPALNESDSRPKPPRNLRSALIVAGLSGVLVGLLILLPILYYRNFGIASERLREPRDYAHENSAAIGGDWALYQRLKRDNQRLGGFSPVLPLESSLRANLLRGANSIIDEFRNSSDQNLSDFDWPTARLCLLHALELNGSDTEAKGKLALCDGYTNLAQNPKLPKAALSIDNFRAAESYLPRSPDPHLGLARLYVYAYRNIGEAMAEFHLAEQLGLHPGPREIEQQGDGCRFRAEWELARARNTPEDDKQDRAKWLAMARSDLERARSLYEPILGYATVSRNLKQLDQDRGDQAQMEAEPARAAVKKAVVRKVAVRKPHVAKRDLSARRWQ